jgi:UDP:flavonoid glycosyltransferase YjiC (YdhE family)
LLHRCSVVVTNGGAGTIIAALEVGVPLVIVPTAWDKPDNARRVVEAGVGVMLSPRQCSPERLRASVETVLNDPGYRSRASAIARRFAEASGPEKAAELLENLVAPASQRNR